MTLFKLKRSGGPKDLEISMAGLKLGKSVLQVDGSDSSLIAALAKVVGLSGQACAVAQTSGKAELFEKSAAKEGVLVEVKVAELTLFPYQDDTFDLVLLKQALGELNQTRRVLCLQQVFRVLKVTGRCLVIDTAIRGGLGALFSQRSIDRRYSELGGAEHALKEEGFHGVRLLGEREGLAFVEGTKPTSRSSD